MVDVSRPIERASVRWSIPGVTPIFVQRRVLD
jgi:hypothetical protein